MRMNLDMWLAAILFLPSWERRSFVCEFDYCILAIGSKYASNKGMPAV